MTVKDLIDRLRDLPPEWQVYATRSGGSLEVWDPEPDATSYGFVFTDDRAPRFLNRRRRKTHNGHRS